jgi:hypothetical protein
MNKCPLEHGPRGTRNNKGIFKSIVQCLVCKNKKKGFPREKIK